MVLINVEQVKERRTIRGPLYGNEVKFIAISSVAPLRALRNYSVLISYSQKGALDIIFCPRDRSPMLHSDSTGRIVFKYRCDSKIAVVEPFTLFRFEASNTMVSVKQPEIQLGGSRLLFSGYNLYHVILPFELRTCNISTSGLHH